MGLPTVSWAHQQEVEALHHILAGECEQLAGIKALEHSACSRIPVRQGLLHEQASVQIMQRATALSTEDCASMRTTMNGLQAPCKAPNP